MGLDKGLDEIAQRILVHLQRFEADPEINKTIDGKTGWDAIHFYFRCRAKRAGAYVGIDYCFTGPAHRHDYYLSKAEALEYLDWLDWGGVGRHHTEFKEWKWKQKQEGKETTCPPA